MRPSSDGTVEFEAELWEHEGQGAWHFVTVPEAVSYTHLTLPTILRV